MQTPPERYPALYRLLAAACACALLLAQAACSDGDGGRYEPRYGEAAPTEGSVYVFASHPRFSPQKMAEAYGAIVDAVNKRLAADGIRLRLEASRDYKGFNEKLRRRQVHFALPNPYQAVLAQDFGYGIFGKMDDDDEFRGVIVVRKDSPVATLDQLRGKTVSFPAPTALAGTMMPELFLHENGVNPLRDIREVFAGNHTSVLMNVVIGSSAAGCTYLAAWRGFVHERPDMADQLEIRWRTNSLPNNGLIVRDDVPPEVRDKVAAALFALGEHPEGQQILHAAETRGFVPADAATFAPVRDFMQKYEKAVRPLQGLYE